MDAWAGGAERRITKSRSYVTTAGGAMGGVRTEVSRGIAERCMGGGRRSLRRLEGEWKSSCATRQYITTIAACGSGGVSSRSHHYCLRFARDS